MARWLSYWNLSGHLSCHCRHRDVIPCRAAQCVWHRSYRWAYFDPLYTISPAILYRRQSVTSDCMATVRLLRQRLLFERVELFCLVVEKKEGQREWEKITKKSRVNLKKCADFIDFITTAFLWAFFRFAWSFSFSMYNLKKLFVLNYSFEFRMQWFKRFQCKRQTAHRRVNCCCNNESISFSEGVDKQGKQTQTAPTHMHTHSNVECEVEK